MRYRLSMGWLAVCLAFIVSGSTGIHAQDRADPARTGYYWWDPAANPFPVIEGQGWPAEVQAPYDRLPARAEKTVTANVWNLSRQSAGLYIKFKTNATEITIRYGVKGNLAMNHMPATGVSGVDLYAIDVNGSWVWAPGRFTFGDTVEYRFAALRTSGADPDKEIEYRLFLPLYNSVKWMRIGTPESRKFTPMPLSPEKPVVVYGTSIAQGGCTTRPGLAWTALLERKLDRPLFNLGFSGNGKLDPAVIDLLTEIDAKLYVLDCLPNMTPSGGFTAEEVEKRLVAAVKEIRRKRPATPILLVEHSGGGTDKVLDTTRYNDFEGVNRGFRKVFARLQAEGIGKLYALGNREIGLDIESTVDGVHPNDIGMSRYADAYEQKIRAILSEPSGQVSTTIPIVQSRDSYNWRERHQEILALNRQEPPRNIILGNSIIHFWGGRPGAAIQHGKDSWDRFLEPAGLRNQAYGWDRVENVLWRIYHDELDGFSARHVIIMIGTNNLELNTDAEIITGLDSLIRAVRSRQPSASLLVSGILPRRDLEDRVARLNKGIASLAARRGRRFVNPGPVLLNAHGKIDESLFSDGLHPNATGYARLAPLLAGYLKE